MQGTLLELNPWLSMAKEEVVVAAVVFLTSNQLIQVLQQLAQCKQMKKICQNMIKSKILCAMDRKNVLIQFLKEQLI
jgi:hypothetical protein